MFGKLVKGVHSYSPFTEEEVISIEHIRTKQNVDGNQY